MGAVENDEYRLVAVGDLQIGDVVDLEGDEYADPLKDNTLLQNEYQEVSEVEVEEPGCVLVCFNDFMCGFPPDHQVKVRC